MATISKDSKGPAVAASERPDPMPRRDSTPSAPPGRGRSMDERRSHDRVDVEWAVDCIADDTFLYASITNISAMGIFVKTTDPLAVGTGLVLSLAPPGYEAFKLQGEVAWINALRPNGDNPNPGMGVRFVNLQPDDRERLVEVIRTIAYVRDPA
jgi:type IV pilus assembly protein PilZ